MTSFAVVLHALGEAGEATVYARLASLPVCKREVCAIRMNSCGGAVVQEQSADRQKHAQ